jgi:hypothetical protein
MEDGGWKMAILYPRSSILGLFFSEKTILYPRSSILDLVADGSHWMKGE